jgi:hypothetical protein
MADDTYGAKQVASRIGTDAKTLRKFLRSSASPYTAVGQGKRYEFPKGDLKKIQKAFEKWRAKSIARTATPKSKTATPIEVIDEMIDDNEPNADDLAAIEDEDLDLELDDD